MLRRIDATDPLGVDMTLRGCSSRFYDGILGKKNSEDDRRRRRRGKRRLRYDGDVVRGFLDLTRREQCKCDV